MQKKRSKGRFQAIRHLFRRRNIIIVSDESIDHYPVGGKLQLLGFLAVVGLFSWISYSTGSYMASQAVLAQKDQQLVTTTLHSKQIGQEYSLLKRDLLKLKENNGELGEYAQFVLDQHKDAGIAEFASAFSATGADADSTSDRLIERIGFLEERIDSLKEENNQIVLAVRERTQDKIKELREVISIAGLSPRKMEKRAEREVSFTAPADDEGQGGPYIPEELSELGSDFFTDIDRMMLLDTVVSTMPLARPVQQAKLTSGFGRRVDPFTRRWAMHSGQDFSAKRNAPIYAPTDGIVTIAERHGAYGNLVELSHGLGLTSRYGHLSSIAVRDGQHITAGQILGYQGSTGRSTGAHLHYEIHYNGRALNPANFLKAGEHVQK